MMSRDFNETKNNSKQRCVRIRMMAFVMAMVLSTATITGTLTACSSNTDEKSATTEDKSTATKKSDKDKKNDDDKKMDKEKDEDAASVEESTEDAQENSEETNDEASASNTEPKASDNKTSANKSNSKTTGSENNAGDTGNTGGSSGSVTLPADLCVISGKTHEHEYNIPIYEKQDVMLAPEEQMPVFEDVRYFWCRCGYASTSEDELIAHKDYYFFNERDEWKANHASGGIRDKEEIVGYKTIPASYETRDVIVDWQCECGAKLGYAR